jgi:Relaxase/Mobilisation nuclease domain
MVARINTSKNISKVLNYNEQKVTQKKAEILLAKNFLKDANSLNFYDKLRHFEKHTSLNQRAKTNAMHVSLNFDPSENLSNEKLIEIANTYMAKVGFSSQPYLIYRHYDAGHPHIHIVTTNIEANGKRISMHNLGLHQSEQARKEIEKEFGLVKAEDKKNADNLKIQPVNASKVTYGRSETRQAISNVLGPVLNQYRFSSMAELNAVLKLYNIVADGGQEGSRINRNNGLIYHMLDGNGNKTGIGIKASSFFMKPTLKMLESKFESNDALRQPHKKRLTANIDWILNRNILSMSDFIKAMEKENISVVLRQNKEGLIYGLTYVDHKTKCVFNGSDLGKQYSARQIQERCIKSERQEQIEVLAKEITIKSKSENISLPSNAQNQRNNSLIDALIHAQHANGDTPFELRSSRKKKRKKIHP